LILLGRCDRGTGVLIDIMMCSAFGIGLFVLGGRGFSLTQDRNRPTGRHSLDDDRVKPKDLPKEWQQLRWTAVTALAMPLLVLAEVDKAPDPLRFPARLLAITITTALLIWELSSWRRFTDPADRLRAFSSVRWFFAPAVAQLLWLLHIWDKGMARSAVVAMMIVIMIGPDLESWARRRLLGRAGGTTTS
jgi:hypothetical protein